ncbi:bifunctional pyr operon transcriptional regulator/uracil phosphoribosyltransferase PyrR [Candidatus Magnetominusculus dajiuhuensis]|uniref:bifunctional pyr operon transcriptional regulator/uracil phosphoribosyltransferase PyrR n=1 Tax=Candidatus Magnetominusculus dajiuhuensis TaxID=3137712 RepID=UPI003B435071
MIGRELLNETDIARMLSRMAHEIIERNEGCEDVCIVGIHRAGVYIARRLSQIIQLIEGVLITVASLDISFYRDDLNLRKNHPIVRKTEMPIDINDKKIILVDDVLYTGRTIRAAMDALNDFGRPAQIQLAVLIDRGHRELPIRADYVGKNIPTSRSENIKVLLKEDAEQDKVLVVRKDGND